MQTSPGPRPSAAVNEGRTTACRDSSWRDRGSAIGPVHPSISRPVGSTKRIVGRCLSGARGRRSCRRRFGRPRPPWIGGRAVAEGCSPRRGSRRPRPSANPRSRSAGRPAPRRALHCGDGPHLAHLCHVQHADQARGHGHRQTDMIAIRAGVSTASPEDPAAAGHERFAVQRRFCGFRRSWQASPSRRRWPRRPRRRYAFQRVRFGESSECSQLPRRLSHKSPRDDGAGSCALAEVHQSEGGHRQHEGCLERQRSPRMKTRLLSTVAESSDRAITASETGCAQNTSARHGRQAPWGWNPSFDGNSRIWSRMTATSLLALRLSFTPSPPFRELFLVVIPTRAPAKASHIRS